MAAPNFNDIGKSFKDLLTKQFPVGFVKVTAKFPETNGVGINVDGSYEIATKVLGANIETKVPAKLGGLNFTWIEKWTNKNELLSSVQINSIQNISNTLEALYDPISGNSTLKLKNAYKSEAVSASGDITFKSLKPEFSLSAMTKLSTTLPLYGGATITLDSKKVKYTNMGYGIQYETPDLCWSATVQNNKEFMSQLYLKVSDLWQVGWETGWDRESKKPNFSGGSQYALETGSLLKTKINAGGVFSIAYCFQLLEGMKLTLAMSVNSANMSSGSHQFGVQLDV